MNNVFDFNEKEINDLIENNFENYKQDPNYNKNLDTTFDLHISEKERETEKNIKVKQDVSVCKKNCNKCKTTTDKIYNLLENKCGETKVKNKIITVKISEDVKNGQSILFMGEGKKQNEQYGNLVVNIWIGEK